MNRAIDNTPQRFKGIYLSPDNYMSFGVSYQYWRGRRWIDRALLWLARRMLRHVETVTTDTWVMVSNGPGPVW